MSTKLTLILSTGLLLVLFYSCKQANKKESAEGKDSTAVDSLQDHSGLLPGIQSYIHDVESEFDQIPVERREQLNELADFIETKNSTNAPVNLVFICTHNSRRSHMGQIWAQAAAFYYQVENVHCFSGGTEATAFNARAIHALRESGFSIGQMDSSANPLSLATFSNERKPIEAFSKKYDDEANPKDNFAAIMTCSQADKACPMVPGAEFRLSIPYEDPKVSDGTPEEEAVYAMRNKQIATEMSYVFSKIKKI
ncbi:MAG: protein-tyrosine-phosphatase [Cyclobacteriaceae bacterium]|nr:protein-tyrosine-phosphatase [Cyclobacteriaceae bacterium]